MRILVALLLVVHVAHAGDRIQLDRVVAIVDDAVILQSELDARAGHAAPAVSIERTLAAMIDEELIVQAAQRARIEVADAEVSAAIDAVMRENALDDAGLRRELAAQGFTMASYRAIVRRQLLRLRAINQLAPDRPVDAWVRKLRERAYVETML
jgi:peptidyl-prolyl cis-trans isomerase SurA